MQINGERSIPASRQKVWEALNDPEVLKACIPGCEELDKTSDHSFAAKVKAKVGPVSAKFNGEVTLSDMNPPESYTISGEGKGGAAGFAKGGAKVHLKEEGPASTLLTYDVEAKVGGKLAQVGSRLIDGTAKKMADQFFTAFAQQVGDSETGGETGGEPSDAQTSQTASQATPQNPDSAAAKTEPAKADDTAARESKQNRGYGPVSWVFMVVAVVVILLFVFGVV